MRSRIARYRRSCLVTPSRLSAATRAMSQVILSEIARPSEPASLDASRSETVYDPTMPDATGPIEPQRHYIDGEFRPSLGGRTFETLNPATNEVLALAAAGPADD